MNAATAPSDFRRARRRLLGTWVALMLLLAASLGSAYLRLGVFNTVASYGIALVKIALVVIVFMRWRRADGWSRAAGFAAACALVLLAALTWFEARTREPRTVPWQAPAQLPPLRSRCATTRARTRCRCATRAWPLEMDPVGTQRARLKAPPAPCDKPPAAPTGSDPAHASAGS